MALATRAWDARAGSTPRSPRVARGSRVARARAIDPGRDVVVVTGALERVAQCVAARLRENEKSTRVRVVASLPAEAFEGVRNPKDARSTELWYPHENTLGLLREYGVELAREDAREYKRVERDATCVVFADETSKRLRASVEAFARARDAGAFPKLRRVVLLSRVGVERRDQDPFKFMNRKTFRGGAPLDDCVFAEEAIRARAAKKINPGGRADGWTYTIVRTGELRGNGPAGIAFGGDYGATLVDNAFDVRMQDIDVAPGDTMNGRDYTKRLSAAVFVNRMLTTSRYDVLNATYSIVSTGPVPRERRMGYDVAKGKSPPPLSDREVDEQLAPRGEDERVPGGAPVPT